MKKLLIFILWGISLIIFQSFFPPLVNGNISISILGCQIFTFIISYFFIKNHPTLSFLKSFSIIILPFLLLTFAVSFFSGFQFSWGLLVFTPITFNFAWQYTKKKKIITIFSFTAIIALATFFIYPNVTEFTRKKNDFSKNKVPTSIFINKEKDTVLLKKDKILVLDFWTTNCGICFRKFPEFEKIKNKYNNNGKIEFYAVNVPVNNEVFDKRVSKIEQYNYSFSKLYTTNEVENKLNIESYPQLIVIKNDTIRYTGTFSTNKALLFHNTENIVEKLLDEK